MAGQQRKQPHPYSHLPTWRGNTGAAPALTPSRAGGCLATMTVPGYTGGCPLPHCRSAVTAESILTLQDMRIQRILSLAKHFGDASRHSKIPWFGVPLLSALHFTWIPNSVHFRMGIYHTLKACLQLIRDSHFIQTVSLICGSFNICIGGLSNSPS